MGDDLKLDWQVYYDAAAKCHEIATNLRAADKPLHDAVKNDCAGMAGDANGCKQWGTKYDQLAQQTMQTCTNLADALTNYGYVLSAMGYNYAVANNSNPLPQRPVVAPLPEYKVTIASSVGDNGPGVHEKDGAGIKEFYDKLVDKIGEEFGKLPNGDVDKLSKASTAWRTFAEHATITGSAGQLAGVIGLFDGVADKKNLELVLENLTTLRDSAGQVALAAQNLATPVAEFHTGTVDARKTFESEINTLVIGAGIAVALGVVAAAFSFGGSLAVSGGAVVGLVANTINAIRTAYTASRLYRIVGLTAATATAAVVLTHFDKVPSEALLDLSAKLTAIIGMRVLIDGADGVQPGSSNASNTPGTTEYQKRVEELAQDPAKNGKVNPQSKREAEVGLGLENSGAVEGPITRAPLGANGEDQGEFIDASGKRWDVKSSPDVIPDYRPAQVAGNPIPNPQTDQEFTEMIEDSIADGEGVMIDQSGMTPARIARLKQLVESHPEWQGKVLW
ncbi:hypothetical protein [Nocardia brasiliensis]|uniref:hypothetical protein n=1 Tax=Nocardia brasiliensis TaxID=37326 RepID=UPI0024574DDA|nr:hypothetical protein [Nocardia brasiliensis]